MAVILSATLDQVRELAEERSELGRLARQYLREHPVLLGEAGLSVDEE